MERFGDVEISLEFFKNILQGWRHRNFLRNAEAKTFGLTWTMVRILADDDDFYLIEGGLFEGLVDEVVGGVDWRWGGNFAVKKLP